METGKMINRISNRLRRRSLKVQESIGISGAQGNILDYILVESVHRNVYQKEIEKGYGLRPSTATGAWKLMEEKGLFCRIPEEKDGRYKRIVFTQKARDVQTALRREIEESESVLLRGISVSEQRQFLEIAKKMLLNLDDGRGA